MKDAAKTHTPDRRSDQLEREAQAEVSLSQRVIAGVDAERRVLVIAPQPFYEDRGTPIAVRKLLEALSYLGYQIDLLTFPVGRSLPIPGVRYLRVPNPLRIRSVPIGFSLRKVWFDLFVFTSLKRLLRRNSYYCIHAVEESAFLAVIAARRHRTPVVYDMQSSIPEHLAEHRLFGRKPARRLLEAAERWLLKRVHYVVSSSGLGGYVRSVSPGTRVREWRYPSPAPVASNTELRQLRADLGLSAEQRVVLYTGNFADYQGLSILFDAAPAVLARAPNTVFVLVGANKRQSTDLARELESRIAGQAYRVLLRQPREAMPAFLRLADIVVSPRTHGSNIPLKALEYLAAGCAIIATSIPAHRSVLTEKTAFLVEPDPQAFALAITALLENPQRAAELRDAARGYAQAHLNWPSFVGSIEELLAELRADGSAASAGDEGQGEMR
ncbi:MAG: glycosyltransferase family 4 protein [Gemmatimonadota bacterium]|nr:MAG: glycosyltransferase family 4 protein [Gemmatimonadota bacterium]